jgi:acetyl-CoA decarbonylase/synthase complex subunit gamma
MALTGIQILKMLPKTNCGECGIPTCLAFGMKVAAGQIEIGACPYVSEEVKETIGEASAPPIRTIKLGSGENTFKAGGETCLFRHEKRFENPTGLGVMLTTDMSDADAEGRIERFNNIRIERVGVLMKPDLIAVKDSKGDENAFSALVKKVLDMAPDANLVLISNNAATLSAAAKLCGERKPLLMGAESSNREAMVSIAKELECPLGVKGSNLDNTVELAESLV